MFLLYVHVFSFNLYSTLVQRAQPQTCVCVGGEGSGTSFLSISFLCAAVPGDSLWVERRTRDRKVASSSPGRSGGRISVPELTF